MALSGVIDGGEAFGRRMTGRLAETVTSLNSLGLSTTEITRRGSFVFSGQQIGDRPTSLQSSILRRLAEKLQIYGTCPAEMTPKSALEDVLKSKDLYSLESSAVAPYDLNLLKVAKTDTIPKPAIQLLPEREADMLSNPDLHIVRSESEIKRWMQDNADFQPYWDKTLREDRAARLGLYRKLADKGLLGFRARIQCKVGLFFVWRASKKGIRLIVDCRMPNGCHCKPDKTRLGGAAALAELDTLVDDGDLPLIAEGYGGPVELPAKLFGNTGDVSDAFYQFSVEPLCEWFGLDDLVRADEFGLDTVWDSSIGQYVQLRPHDKVFPVFLGMPQGWAWALHFCNTAVEYGMSKSIPAMQHLKEGLPAPDIRRGPVSSVYVDNICALGLVESAVDKSFDEAIDSLERAGFVLHELERGGAEITNVGVVISQDMHVRHSRKRAWRLYLALKRVLQMKGISTEALRVVVGHIVHYFSLFRPGLSVLCHCYRFIYRWLDGKSHVIPGSVKRELRVAAGLIFQVDVDLGAGYCDDMYCGDSSTYGYCFQRTAATVKEQRQLAKFHERWRFFEVEAFAPVDERRHQSWSAELETPDLQYVHWLHERLGLPRPGSGELDRGTRTLRCGDQPRKQRSFSVTGLVPPVPDEIVEPEHWQTLVQRKWNFDEPIHMKEARVALMTLRRESKKKESHGKRLVTLCDNMAAVCAFDKGRAKVFSLLTQCRRSAAIQFATGIRWVLRYVETSRNPSDYGSRHFDPKAIGGNKQRGNRASAPCIQPEAMSEGFVPSVGSQCQSAQSRLCARTQFVRSAKTSSSVVCEAPAVLELFSGSSRLTRAMKSKGLRVAVPFDFCNGPGYDLADGRVQDLIKTWVKSGRIWYIHFGTPCTNFSIAKSKPAFGSSLWTSMRCVRFTAELIDLCHQHGVYYSLENPKTSRLFKLDFIVEAIQVTSGLLVDYDCCRFGCPFRKSTRVATNFGALQQLGRKCRCGKGHDQLRG